MSDQIQRQAREVKNKLMAGNKTARDISRATGLSMVSVYAALVWLEARGRAFLTCQRQGRTGPYLATWEAA